MENIENEVEKIDFGKLENVAWPRRNKYSSFPAWEGVCIYLNQPNRTKPTNILMAMGYEGNSIFKLCSDWNDLVLDDQGFALAGSPMEGIDYLQLDYQGLEKLEIAKNGQVIDLGIHRATVAYALMSRFVKTQCKKFNPILLKKTASLEIKSKFPQEILGVYRSEAHIKKQLIEYLS